MAIFENPRDIGRSDADRIRRETEAEARRIEAVAKANASKSA